MSIFIGKRLFIMQRFQVALLATTILFASCEGGINTEGHVYDKETKQPISNVQVILILDNKDTVIKDRPKNVAETNITDSSTYMPSFTDNNGHFLLSSMLLGCVPKCPDASYLFVKKGYKPLTITGDFDFKDSVRLERIN